MKPMLAAATDGSGIKYPVLVSPKLDGVRALVVGGVVVSRSLKPIPNRYVQRLFGHEEFNGLDGELVVGNAFEENVFQATTSGVMSVDGRPDVSFHVFDDFSQIGPFVIRFARAKSRLVGGVKLVPHHRVNSQDELARFEDYYTRLGYEGLMIRDPQGLYKYGRSTVKQGWLLKLKRFEDAEARIVGMKELMHNANAPKKNALGHQERSHKKAGMVSRGTMGALTVEDLRTGVLFDIGTGFTEIQRAEFWECQDAIMGGIVKYKFQPSGVKDKPRFPVFLGFRDARDL